ncbi:hypothetical protein [Flavobacterium collinsii]|uniref:Glycerophosphoryl diester phosphodiesterase membrane domain-containing protein n=1 Tax=Flavobacterium collinsii TaxID=1114861 RepID=A0A9W4X6K0_9FLAO|nr:hypothetical protein [Flavobacterium collinsii]CAI2767270.1 conserved membrane protein of unknown function [Flavobacterium collinsii]
MFELYKKRQLGDYIIDTFSFFKTFGKHFFKIFFIINGAFLLIVGTLVFFFLKSNFQAIFNQSLNHPDSDNLAGYFNDNFGLLIGFIAIFFVVIIALSLFNSTYPILYLKLIDQKNKSSFTTADVVAIFRQNLWKIIKFCVGLIFLVVPMLFVVIILLFFLCFLIVGIPLLLIAIPTLFTWVNFSFYAYLTEDKGFFQSLNHAYLLLKEDFWTSIGATFLVIIMMQMIQGSITMVFYFIGIFMVFLTAMGTSEFNPEAMGDSPFLVFFLTSMFILIFTLSNIFNNMIMVNQGIMYYSLGAKDKISNRDIELIGTDNE